MRRIAAVVASTAAVTLIGSSAAMAVPLPTPSYSTFPYSGAASGSSSLITGIRTTGTADPDLVYISGVYKPTTGGTQGLVYTGPLSGSGTWTALNRPSTPNNTTASTALYGPDNIGSTGLRVVGSYKTSQTAKLDHGVIVTAPTGPTGTLTWATLDATSLVTTGAHAWKPPAFTKTLSLGMSGAPVRAVQVALLHLGYKIPSITAGTSKLGVFGSQTSTAVIAYQKAHPSLGTSTGTINARTYKSITTDSLKNTIAHSTRGGLVVGNFDTRLVAGRAFVTNTSGSSWFEITKAGAVSITAYGIWYNSPGQYTIAGGYFSPPVGTAKPVEHAYLVNYASATRTLSGWTSYDYGNRTSGDLITHFDGITPDGSGGFNLTGDRVGVGALTRGEGFFANVGRTSSGAFKAATWKPVKYPSSVVTSGNSVYQQSVIGVYALSGSSIISPYIADFSR
ncbi:MAG: peptidoglycan-binding domain-containing protein [Actinomycetes bacterium]